MVAIGYPLGLDRTATSGIVSGLERQIQSPNGFSIDKVIQTDAAVNPGNSGGPLLNAKGQVIGVNSQIATAAGGGEGNVGIAFAIPVNTVKQVLPDLESGTAPKHAYLGLQTTQAQSGQGAQIADATAGGPAAARGPADRRRGHQGRRHRRSRPPTTSRSRSRTRSPATRSRSRCGATAPTRPSR